MSSLTEQRAKEAIHVTRVGIVWNVVLTIIKFAAAIFGRSSALLADAIHSFSDFISDIVILAGLKIASKPKDANHHYGHGKFETLSTLILTLFLFGAAFGMLWEGGRGLYQRYLGIQIPIPKMITLWVAAASILIKELLFHYTIRSGNSLNSKALITNAWHHRTDAFTSVAVLIGLSGAIFLGPKWRILDPAIAIGISGYIIHFAAVTFKSAIDELLDASLGDSINENIMTIVRNVPGVLNPHNLKTRKVGNNYSIDMHIHVQALSTIVEGHDIATNVETKLRDKYGADTIISIHIEPDTDPARFEL